MALSANALAFTGSATASCKLQTAIKPAMVLAMIVDLKTIAWGLKSELVELRVGKKEMDNTE